MGWYRVVFYNGSNTSTDTRLVVCIDKDLGVPGCGVRDDGTVEGDWVHPGPSTPNSRVETEWFNPVSKLTIAVTSPCYDYKVEVVDEGNNVLLTVYYDGRTCGAFPFFVPTPTPTITPTPTSTSMPTPTEIPSQGCSPLIKVGIEFLDRVVFCVGGYGVTVAVVVAVFLLLLLLRKRKR